MRFVGFMLFAAVALGLTAGGLPSGAKAAEGVTQKCGASGDCSAQCNVGTAVFGEVSPAASFSLTKIKSKNNDETTVIAGIREADGDSMVVLGGSTVSCWTRGMQTSETAEDPVRQSFIPSSTIECRAESCSVSCYSNGGLMREINGVTAVSVTNFFAVTGAPINPAERRVYVETEEGGPYRLHGGPQMACALVGF